MEKNQKKRVHEKAAYLMSLGPNFNHVIFDSKFYLISSTQLSSAFKKHYISYRLILDPSKHVAQFFVFNTCFISENCLYSM